MLQACCSGDTPEKVYSAIRAEVRRGEYRTAEAHAEQAYAKWKNKPNTEWHWNFRLLVADLRITDGRTAAGNELLNTSPPAQFANLEPEYDRLRAYAAFRDQHPAEAVGILNGAEEKARKMSNHEAEADIALMRVNLSGLDATAKQKLLENIVAIGQRYSLPVQLAQAYLNYGMLRIGQSRWTEALEQFEHSAGAAQKAGATLLYWIAVGNMATCYYNLGDFERSLSTRQKAIEQQKRAGLKPPLRDSYLELGISQFLQGQPAEAAKSFREALSLISAKDSAKRYSLVASNLASALEATGAVDEAENWNREAERLRKNPDPDFTASILQNKAAIAEHRGEDQKAIDLYCISLALKELTPATLWSGHAALASVYVKTGDISSARQHFEAAIHTVEVSRAEQLKSDYKITFLSRLIQLYQDYVQLLMQQGDSARALEVADESRASVLTEDLTGKLRAGEGALVPRLQRIAKTTGVTFLFYWLAPKQSYVWVITQKSFRAVPLINKDRIAQDVKSYRYLLEQEKLDPLASAQKLPSRLFHEVVEPALDGIPKNSPVVIVADDALHGLDFESLVVDSPQPHYWLYDATVAMAPSLSILTRSSPSSKRDSLLLFGDPDFAGTGFSKLPQAGEEISRVSSFFPPAATTIRRGTQAVPSAYEATDPKRFSVLHFATHSEANEQSPLESAIILSKGKEGSRLYAREIMRVPLTAELVTLSACRGAGARTFTGEGPVGFAWAFFQAGAHNVVAGLWDVNDASTSQLMNNFYGELKNGKSYASALRSAKLSLIEAGYRKPYFWAPFQLYTRNPKLAR